MSTYITKDGKHQWFKKDEKLYCKKCYNNLFTNPKWNPITRISPRYAETRTKSNKTFTPRHYLYAKRCIVGWARLLTGYCSRCTNNIYDGTCKKTDMHHLFYIVIFPWFGRQELCAACHVKEGRRVHLLTP